MLKVKNLSLSYKNQVILDSINLDFQRGQIYTIVGKSGAGKSTLIKTISGEIKYEGKIFLDDVLLNQSLSKRPVVTMHQGMSLFPHLNVKNNILFGIRSSFNKERFENIDEKKYCESLLQQVELEGFEEKFPHELSGGEQQRVALARSIAVRPKVLLLDEPFSALNQSLKFKLNQLVSSIVKEENIICLMITHDNNEALNISESIVLVQNKNCYISEADSVIKNPFEKNIMNYFRNGFSLNNKLYSVHSLKDLGSQELSFNIKDKKVVGNLYQYLLDFNGQELMYYSKEEKSSPFKLYLN